MSASLSPPSPVRATIDLDGPGRRFGHLMLPWSRDDSAWGHLATPIAVVDGGPGPTALCIGGSHGDEYEGPLAIYDLALTLDPADLRGRVLLVPALNAAAFCAATRVSPVDGVNMNRAFPGGSDGAPSEKIADYVLRALAAPADLVIDIHSGGRTLDFLPFAACHRLDDAAQEARCWEAAQAFGAPYALKMTEIDATGMLDTAVEAMGKTFVTTELGGAGYARRRTVEIAKTGLRRVLAHVGLLAAAAAPPPSTPPSRVMSQDDACFAFAPRSGLIDPAADLGDTVCAGDVLARLHDVERLGAAPVAVRAARDGLVIGRSAKGLAAIGDCLAVLAFDP